MPGKRVQNNYGVTHYNYPHLGHSSCSALFFVGGFWKPGDLTPQSVRVYCYQMTTEFTLTFISEDEQADKEFRELLKKLVKENPKVKLKIIDETAQQKNPTN